MRLKSVREFVQIPNGIYVKRGLGMRNPPLVDNISHKIIAKKLILLYNIRAVFVKSAFELRADFILNLSDCA